MNAPHELTNDEVRENVLCHIWEMIEYWGAQKVTPREQLIGLAFSILVMIDGESTLPAFVLVPAPHPDDREFRKSEGEDWYPGPAPELEHDIAGSLHERFYDFDPRKRQP